MKHIRLTTRPVRHPDEKACYNLLTDGRRIGIIIFTDTLVYAIGPCSIYWVLASLASTAYSPLRTAARALMRASRGLPIDNEHRATVFGS